jgi:two-component system phosphate regulon response regulator PhoB
VPKNTMMPSVLIVEDEDSIVALLEYNLEKAGYFVRSTADGEEALLMIEESMPDIVLLDWMLPNLTGLQICKRIRSNKRTAKLPIIMLSARGEESDKIDGLEGGVDDYLVKPFSPKELMARINAVFRRIRPAFSQETLEYGDVKMDITTRQVYFKGNEVTLGPIEYRLLQALMEHPNRVLSREQVIRRVWGYSDNVEPRTVDVHINRLRKGLGLSKTGTVVKTIRASGYCIRHLDAKELYNPIDNIEDN